MSPRFWTAVKWLALLAPVVGIVVACQQAGPADDSKTPAVLSTMMLASAPESPPLTGAIFTTDRNGTLVNGNIYQDCCEVFLNGGPPPSQPCSKGQDGPAAAGLPDGDYYFQVTDPAGKVLLSTDDVRCRKVRLSGGLMVRYLGNRSCQGTCKHEIGKGKCQGAGFANISVQLMPFNPTLNPGGVHKVWMTRVEDYDESDPLANFGFCENRSKTDNFKCAPRACDLKVTIENVCQIDGSGTLNDLCARVTGGTPPYHYEWLHNGSCVNGDSECIAPPELGIYSVTVTDSSVPPCSDIDTAEVFENPTCSIEPPVASPCVDDPQTFTVKVDKGTPPYEVVVTGPDGFTPVTATISEEGGSCDFTTCIAGTYTATVTCSAPAVEPGCIDTGPPPICDTRCICVLDPAPCLCRVTGGGNDTFSPWPWDGTFAEGKHSKNNGDTDFYTFGGQAGAPSASQPQPYGEWTHRQHKGPDGSFTFHAGTHSAPPETMIAHIRCRDKGWCSPAREAPAKQIDFDGVGQFKNITGQTPVKAAGAFQGKTLHWFAVHIEDAGEPGNKTEAGADCPETGHAEGFVDCGCADFYHITIHQTADPASAVIYDVYGYINGGNLQIHPAIDK